MSEDVTMGAPEDLLVSRRSRRSTAGNRYDCSFKYLDPHTLTIVAWKQLWQKWR